MKKLLILMLVLGMVSMANAALTMRYSSQADGSDTITATALGSTFYLIIAGVAMDDISTTAIIVADVADAMYTPEGSSYADFTGSNNSLFDNGNGYAAAGNASDLGSLTTYDSYSAYASDNYVEEVNPEDPTGPWIPITIDDPLTGDWFSYEILAGDVEGTAKFARLTSGWDGYTTNASILIPEPMTIALLGLGGLFLRRRK